MPWEMSLNLTINIVSVAQTATHPDCGSYDEKSQKAKNYKDMTTPSLLSAIQKLGALLTRSEKLKGFGIVGFAICTSLLEMLTASVIVGFAQVLNAPETGQHYLSALGWNADLPPGHIVFYAAIFVGIIYIVKNIVAGIEVFYQNFTIQKMNYHFKNKLLRLYTKTDYGFYLTRNSSFGIQVVGGDTEHMFSGGMISLASILSESVIFLGLIGLIIYINPSLAFAIFGIGALCGWAVTKGLLPQFYRFGQRLQNATLYSSQNLIQFFHGFKEIVLLGKQETFIQAYRQHSEQRSHIQAMQTAINTLPRMIIEVLFVGLFVIAIAFLCLGHDSPAQMIGTLGGYLYVGFRLMPGLNRIISQLNALKASVPFIERVYSEYNMLQNQTNYIHVPDFQFTTSINLQNLCFRYLNTEKDALTQVSLQIKKGECIGIIGKTGSGKSTLVDILLGLLRPDVGSVLVDNTFPVHSHQWHQKIGYVPQSIYLTDDTIAANIAFGDSHIDEPRLNAAIEAAQLQSFVQRLPQGIQTIVGERGVRLSGGERQRIAIARALYRNPEVLIFDEATSALDHETEEKLMKTIHAVSQNRTVIMIAHRLTTLKNCGRIIRMAQGQIQEITQYDKLTQSDNMTHDPVEEDHV